MPKCLHIILIQDYHIILTMTLASLCIPVTVWMLLKYFVNKSVGAMRARILSGLFTDGSQTLKMVPGT